MEIIRGLKKDDDEFTGGTITDPKTGKHTNVPLQESGDKLNVRGYIGLSLIGRTQTWQKVTKNKCNRIVRRYFFRNIVFCFEKL
jgi:uncharacterized protein (DUF2147 family)